MNKLNFSINNRVFTIFMCKLKKKYAKKLLQYQILIRANKIDDQKPKKKDNYISRSIRSLDATQALCSQYVFNLS